MPKFGKKWRKSFPRALGKQTVVIEYQYVYFKNGPRKLQSRMVKPFAGPWEYQS